MFDFIAVVVSDNTAKVIVMVTCFPQSVHEKQNDNAPEQPKNGGKYPSPVILVLI